MKMNETEGSYEFWDRFNNDCLKPTLEELEEALESSDISSSSKIRWFVLKDIMYTIIHGDEENQYYRDINEIL